MVPSLFFLVACHVDFFFSRYSKSQKNNVEKRLGPFDIRKVPDSKKTCKKQENLLHSVKTK
jgi:hypothetical protein